MYVIPMLPILIIVFFLHALHLDRIQYVEATIVKYYIRSSHTNSVSLPQEHKPNSPKEMHRIKESGGAVMAKAGVNRVVWQRPKKPLHGPIRRSTLVEKIPFLAVARSLGKLPEIIIFIFLSDNEKEQSKPINLFWLLYSLVVGQDCLNSDDEIIQEQPIRMYFSANNRQ